MTVIARTVLKRRFKKLFSRPDLPMAIYAAVFTALAVLAAAGCAGPRPDVRVIAATARHEIWHDIGTGGGGSAVAVVMDNGKVVYREGFAAADRDSGRPVDGKTIFNIGSVSKVYCAAAVMLLVDEGKIALDDPVTRHLPDFTMADERYREITVRMLLNHTSGLPGGTYANMFGFAANPDVYRNTLENLSRSRLKHDPGARAVYCNDGFTLAEMIVARVSGREFIDFLTERIFQPLGLRRTGLSVGERRDANTAIYYRADTGEMEPLEVVSLLGAGGLSASAADLCRFLDVFSVEGNRLFSAGALEELKKIQPPARTGRLRNPDMAFGLGWDMVELPRYREQGIQVLGKSGGTLNYTTMVYVVPEHRVASAVIFSGPHSDVMEIALEILDAALAARGLLEMEEAEVFVPVRPQPIPAELAGYAGYYFNNDALYRAEVRPGEETAEFFKVVGEKEEPALTLTYGDGYFHKPDGKRYYFISDDGVEYLAAVYDVFGVDVIVFEKLPELDRPVELGIDVDGRRWLRRDISPYEGAAGLETGLVASHVIADLPGYVDFSGVKKVVTPEFAGMAGASIRDQSELTLYERAGEVWARVSDMIYSPATPAGELAAGENAVVIGGEGLAEWRRAAEEAVIEAEPPAGGRLAVFDSDGVVLRDSAITGGRVYVPADGWILCAGMPGDTFTITFEAIP